MPVLKCGGAMVSKASTTQPRYLEDPSRISSLGDWKVQKYAKAGKG